MRFRIVREWDDHDPAILGLVEIPLRGSEGKQRQSGTTRLRKLWGEFQSGKPDSDDQFMDFLKKKGYAVVADEPCVDVTFDG